MSLTHKSKYLAYVLSPVARAKLLALHPPKHERVIAHHVTVQFNVTHAGLTLLAQPERKVLALAYGFNDLVDCVLINFDGTINRLDGNFYHVTLSCSAHGKPANSNDLLKTSQGSLSWMKHLMVLDGKLELVDK